MKVCDSCDIVQKIKNLNPHNIFNESQPQQPQISNESHPKLSQESPAKLPNDVQAKQKWRYTGAYAKPKLNRQFEQYGCSVNMVDLGNMNIVSVCEKMIQSGIDTDFEILKLDLYQRTWSLVGHISDPSTNRVIGYGQWSVIKNRQKNNSIIIIIPTLHGCNIWYYDISCQTARLAAIAFDALRDYDHHMFACQCLAESTVNWFEPSKYSNIFSCFSF